MNLTIQPKLTNSYYSQNNNIRKNKETNPFEEPLYLQKQAPSPAFKGMYDNFVEGIAKHYYGGLMKSNVMKWIGKKTENMNMVNFCSALNSFIISTMYVFMTLGNEKLDPERRNTLAINDGMTYVGSTILAYAIDNKLAKKWNEVTHKYAATQLGTTPEELQRLIDESNSKLYYQQLQVEAIQNANQSLPQDAKIPMKKDIDALIKNADTTLDEKVKTAFKDEVNNAINKANITLPKDKQIGTLGDDIAKIVDKSYELLNAPEGTQTLQDDISNAIKKINESLPEGKKIPLKEDIKKAIENANKILPEDKKVPLIEDIRTILSKANNLLPKSNKIKAEKVIANAEDYARDVIKNRELNFKIKGMGIVKSLFIFGMIYRYVVPVLIMKPANKLGAKYNKRHAEKIEEQNKRIAQLKEFEEKEAKIKELEAKYQQLELKNYANAS